MLRDRNYNIKSKLISDINMIPFIDIMLVILIVFMINSCVLNYGLELKLPKPDHKVNSLSDSKSLLILALEKTGEFNLSTPDKSVSIKTNNLEEVLSLVKSYKSNNSNIQLVIQSDAKTHYEMVAKVIAALQHIEVYSIGLATEAFDCDKGT